MATIVTYVTTCQIEVGPPEDQQIQVIQAQFQFTQQHPYDIDLILTSDDVHDDDIPWKLGREMMDQAAHDPRSKVGEGDVTIETFSSHFAVLLRPPGCYPAKLIFNRIRIREFMDKVNKTMPWDDAVKAALCELDEWLEEAN